MKRNSIFLLLILLLLSSCADVADVTKCVGADPYGFWYGLWHGAIVCFSFIGSLFSDDIAIYAVNNNGGWYDFGFFLGVGSLSISGGRATRSKY